ncbi:hypothetical protein ACER0C_004793 [Sarotherodon galilaeus]
MSTCLNTLSCYHVVDICMYLHSLLLLSWFGGPVNGEISANLEKCLKFFYENTIPQGISGKGYEGICQIYKNKYRFATMYDRTRRIPLYSAYILSSPDGPRPETPWKIEPQLASLKANKEMEYRKNPDQNVKNSQAVDEDYTNSGYTRGHLAPSGHQKTEEDRIATFTLTNIVPQMEKSNSGPWNVLENQMLTSFKEFCKETMYVITGAIPYESGEHVISKRVHVPEYMWTAYCCPTQQKASAAVGRNDLNSKEDIVEKKNKNGYDVKEMSLEDLEKILQKRLNMSGISLFKNKCKK